MQKLSVSGMMVLLCLEWLGGFKSPSAFADAERAARPNFIKVKDEISLSELSLILYGKSSKWKAIAQWNHLSSPYLIRIGQVLKLLERPLLEREAGNKKLLVMWRNRFGTDSDKGRAQVISRSIPENQVAPESIETPHEALLEKPVPMMRDYLITSLGVAGIYYQQTGVSNLTEFGVSLKADYEKQIFDSRWDFQSTAAIAIAGQIDLMDIDSKVGYRIPFGDGKWTLSLLGGAYFTTSFTSGSKFGYFDIFGPEIQPTLFRYFNNGSYLSMDLKYSVFVDDIAVEHFSDYKIAFGSNYIFPILSTGKRASASLDLSRLVLASGENSIFVNQFVFSLGYVW